MNLLDLPWLDASILLAIVGWATVSQIRQPARAFRWGLAFTAASFACALMAWLAFDLVGPAETHVRFSLQETIFHRQLFKLDPLNAPLVPTVALLHFLVALATAKANMRRFSIAWSMAAEAIRLATFSCQEPWILVSLLTISTVPPYIELVNRGKNTGVYVVHMALYLALLIAGWAAIDYSSGIDSAQAQWGTARLMSAILVRCGTIPVHCWVIDWFEKASFGIAMLYVVPLTGVYAAVRLVLPIAPDWALSSISKMSLATAVYAAAMATVQRESRRFYAYLFLSHASLVLVGLELRQALSLTASLCLWFSVILSLGGFGLAIRSLEARFGRLSLVNYHGLYGHSPTLAVCFLLTGLACVGFPATIGFISTELLVDSAVEVNPLLCIALVTAAALNGIAVVRAYLLLFTGAKHTSTVSLEIGWRERLAVLTLAALVLGGGLFPQFGVTSRFNAAQQLIKKSDEDHRVTRQTPAHGRPAARYPFFSSE